MDSKDRRRKSSSSNDNARTRARMNASTNKNRQRDTRNRKESYDEFDEIMLTRDSRVKSSSNDRRNRAQRTRAEERNQRTRPEERNQRTRPEERRSHVRTGTNAKYHQRGRLTEADKKYIRSRQIGIVFAIIEMIASIVFVGAIFELNMLPTRYVMILLGLLVLLGVLLFAGQLFSKKNAITGKVFSILLTLVLCVGSFYVFKVGGTISSITSDGTKVDHMVVSVMNEDTATSLEDVSDYTIGVQYAIDGDDVDEAIEGIEASLESTLNIVEYSDMQSLAVALQEGEVQAAIYNDAHSTFIEDDNPDFSTDVRIVYTYEIATALSLTGIEASNIAVQDESFIIYISGIDVYGSITQTSRSDVNILMQVNPTTHEIFLVTTPRDYYVELPGVSNGSSDKLTHAAIYGVDTSIDTLEALYDIDIDFYARLNFTSLIDVVDALGGVTVYSEESFTTSSNSGYVMNVSEGYNDFTGIEALAFARERKNLADGDNQRGKNQQALIVGMLEKVTSPSIITGANSILDSVSGNIDTNMTDEQIQNLIKMQIDENIEWNVTSVAATGTGSSQYCYSYTGGALYVSIPDYDSVDAIKEQFVAIADGEYLSGADEEEEDETDTGEEMVIEIGN